MDFIPVNQPLLDGNEKKYLAECIDTGWISSEGPFIARLEKEMAARVGRKHGIAVCNGTAALEAALVALDLPPGAEVIMPTFTIISCASAIIRAGLKPVAIDCDEKTWNMDPDLVKLKINKRTKAIMVVHIYGLPVDMDPILELARVFGLKVIEDAAEAHGQTYRGRPCGGFGDISIFSFYPNKHVTTGEGGMIMTNDDALAEQCRSLRNLCFGRKRFVHEKLGWNYRMSNLQAAVGCAQLERLDESIKIKRNMGQKYTELLSSVTGIGLPLPRTGYAENIYWVYGVVLDDERPFDAEEMMKRLADRKVGARPFFWPMHEQPVFVSMGLFKGERCPKAERIARRGLYLPSGLALTGPQIEQVVQNVKEVLA
jgi:perosamine synthetase